VTGRGSLYGSPPGGGGEKRESRLRGGTIKWGEGYLPQPTGLSKQSGLKIGSGGSSEATGSWGGE